MSSSSFVTNENVCMKTHAWISGYIFFSNSTERWDTPISSYLYKTNVFYILNQKYATYMQCRYRNTFDNRFSISET